MERIHAASLAILAQAGVRVLDPESRALLVKAGAKTDPGGEKVYIPRQMVDDCLGTVPSRFSLCRRDGTQLEIGTDSRVFGSLVIDPWIIDFESQKPRRPVLDDADSQSPSRPTHPPG